MIKAIFDAAAPGIGIRGEVHEMWYLAVYALTRLEWVEAPNTIGMKPVSADWRGVASKSPTVLSGA